MRAVVAILVAFPLLLSGCSEKTEDTGRAGASASPSTSISIRTPAPSQSVFSYGPATLVIGSDRFSVEEGTVTTDPDGTLHSRRGRLTSTLTSDDARLSGTVTGTWNTDRWSGRSGAMVQWGTMRITNSGGRWVGRYTGAYTPRTFDILTGWFTGEGDYEGLSMYLWEETSGGTEATFHALVFPGEVPRS